MQEPGRKTGVSFQVYETLEVSYGLTIFILIIILKLFSETDQTLKEALTHPGKLTLGVIS